MKSHIIDRRPSVALYQAKAREMRSVAEHLVDTSAKYQLMLLALGYEMLAEHIDGHDAPERGKDYWSPQASPDAAEG